VRRTPGEYGFMPFSRKMVDGHDPIWEDLEPFDVRSAWSDLLFYARFAPGIVEGEALERGEFLASVRFLAIRWRWGLGRVHRYLRRLEKLERIAERRKGQRGTVYAVVNYETYNATTVRPERGTERPPERERNTSGTKIKKDNKGNSALNDLVAKGCEVWKAEMGGEANFGRLKNVFKALLAEGHPDATILAHWGELFRRNQRQTDKAFISPETWASKFGLYTPPGQLGLVQGGLSDDERYTFLAGEARRGMDMSDTQKYPDWEKYRARYW
jgi:hypothetical protein